jgi:hypothetical protein
MKARMGSVRGSSVSRSGCARALDPANLVFSDQCRPSRYQFKIFFNSMSENTLSHAFVSEGEVFMTKHTMGIGHIGHVQQSVPAPNGKAPSASPDDHSHYPALPDLTRFRALSQEREGLTPLETRERPSAIDFEVAYQTRVALGRIRFAIKHIERLAQCSEQVREVSLQLLDALDRLDELDRHFQTRSRLGVLSKSANGTVGGA